MPGSLIGGAQIRLQPFTQSTVENAVQAQPPIQT
jgi:hypothetical protein